MKLWRFLVSVLGLLTMPLLAYSQDIPNTNFLKADFFLRDTTEILPYLEMSETQKKLLGLSQEFEETQSTKDSLIVESSGYISQSLSSANNKNMSQNTLSDFSVSGVSALGLKVSAQVQDYDFPVSEDGSTDRISELNSFLINVSKDSLSLSFGDVVAKKENSSVMNFSKKTKGVNYCGVSGFEDKDTLFTAAAFSQTKGKFLRIEFYGSDNSQGPYFIKPDNSVISVIILIGTEKIWLDDSLLVSDIDYTIDYNSGSVEFSYKHIISNQSKITVECEYSENFYDRYFMYSEVGLQHKTFNFNLGVVSYFDGISNLGNLTDSVVEKMKQIPSDSSKVYSSDSVFFCPEKKDYLFFSSFLPLEKSFRVKTEMVLENHAKNRLSTEKKSQESFAGLLEIEKDIFEGSNNEKLQLFLSTQYFSEQFSSFNEYKSMDFFQVWNIDNYEKNGTEFFNNFGLKYFSKKVSAQYKFIFSDVKNYVKGYGNNISVKFNGQKNISNFSLNYYKNCLLDSTSNYFDAEFNSLFKVKTLFEYGFSLKIQGGKSLQTNLNYNDYILFVKKNIENGFLKLSFTDRNIFDEYLLREKKSETRFWTLELEKKLSGNFDIKVSQIFKSLNDFNDKNNSLTGNIETNIVLFDKQLNVSVVHNSIMLRTEELSYKFIKTTPGNGYFAWIDYNGDGKEDLDEFEKSFYKTDADYVKYFVHTGKFIDTRKTRTMLHASFLGVDTKKKMSWLFSRLNLQYNLSFNNEKCITQKNFFSIGDSLINGNLSETFLSKIMLIKKLYVGYNFSFNTFDVLSFYGLERTQNRSFAYLIEKKIGKSIIKQQYTKKTDSYLSEFFSQKNYKIISRENFWESQTNYENGFSPQVRYTLKKKNADILNALQNCFLLSLLFQKEKKGSVSLKTELIFNSVETTENLSLMYQISEGLGKGKNLVIGFDSSYFITKFLLLNFMYEFRKAEGSNSLHTGTLELKLIM